MDVLVFKTELHSAELVSKASPVIHSIRGIRKWNVDLQDCDRVLRIECFDLTAREVENALQGAGYFCEELND